jgi:hypothetical protein
MPVNVASSEGLGLTAHLGLRRLLPTCRVPLVDGSFLSQKHTSARKFRLVLRGWHSIGQSWENAYEREVAPSMLLSHSQGILKRRWAHVLGQRLRNADATANEWGHSPPSTGTHFAHSLVFLNIEPRALGRSILPEDDT